MQICLKAGHGVLTGEFSLSCLNGNKKPLHYTFLNIIISKKYPNFGFVVPIFGTEGLLSEC